MRLYSLLADEYMFFRGGADDFYCYAAEACGDWIADREAWLTLHGDVHIGNTGTYWIAGDAEEPELAFGLVDFDEAIEGPFQLDLLRAFVSLRFAAISTGAELPDQEVAAAAKALVRAYEQALVGGATERLHEKPAIVDLTRKSLRNGPEEYVSRYAKLDDHPDFRRARIKKKQVADVLEPVDVALRAQVVDAVAWFAAEGCSEAVRNELTFKDRDDAAASIKDVARWTRVASSGSQGVHKYLVLMKKAMKNGPKFIILELKEEPVPAAARAGLLSAAKGADRAREVADAERRMCDAPQRLLGFTRIGERGFLVSLKDPFGEELEAGDFDFGSDGASEMASILGAATGMAHRNALRGDEARIAAMRSRLSGLSAVLAERSAAAEKRIRAAYAALRDNEEAHKLAAQAAEFIQSAAKGD